MKIWNLSACLLLYTVAYCAEVDNRLTELTVAGETELAGAGGVILDALEIPADARLVLDPIATPIKVSAAPTFGGGSKIALSSDYAGIALGRVVLMIYSGTATIPEGLFDASSVANPFGCVLTQETAPDGTSTQLVLTVGDYDKEAKEIRILPIGDSITHGYSKKLPGTSVYQQAQYRTVIAARLAANGYRPVMLGHLNRDASNTATTCDAAGVRQPDEWISHSGSSGDSIMIHADGSHGGVRDNVHVYLDVAGEPDVITLLIGTNDLKLNETAGDTFIAYTNLVHDIVRQRPNTKIVGSTLLDRSDDDAAAAKVVEFNALLLDNLEHLPSTYSCTNLFLVTSHTIPDVTFDGLHPTAKGFAPVAKGFAAKIMEALPLASYGCPIDTALTDEPQTASGAAATVPAEYLTGMTHVFTIDSTDAAANLAGAAPYTATLSDMPLTQRLKKAGYYMELVRTGTSRRRYVWVDFDAAGRMLGEIDFPWDGDNVDLVVNNMHVYSNDGGVHNIAPDKKGVKGVIEGTRFDYSGTDVSGKGIPADIPADVRGWNDTLATSGNYGCFQAHRIFSQKGDDRHWNDAEVLFAWNRWGGTSGNNEIGIGSFFLSGAFSGNRSMDYTFSSATSKGAAPNIDARAYQVRHLEIWAEPVVVDSENGEWIIESAATSRYTGKWSEDVEYGADDKACLGGDVVFAPYNASTGNVVTIETKTQFCEYAGDDSPDASAQAAVRLGTNGLFQVWTNAWVDVEAEGVTPKNGEEYTLRFTFDYTAGTYSVEVNDSALELQRETPTRSFPLAAETNCVSGIAFVGDTYFTSMIGDCRLEVTGFQPGEITVADATVVLDAAKAAWLNACGDRATVGERLATVTSNEFATAWLCNLDLMNEHSGAELKITGIKVNADNVEIAVTLERTGAVAQEINGVLKFYGASTLAAFKDGAAAPLASATMVDDDFSDGNTATAEFEKGGNIFFNAEIGER